MITEIATKANCPNCGGSISVYIDTEATHVGGDEVEVIIHSVELGAHKCPPTACPQCEAGEE